MQVIKISLLLIVFGVFQSCNNYNYEFWPEDQFHFNPKALKNNSMVRVIYSSRGPDVESKMSFAENVSEGQGKRVENILVKSSDYLIHLVVQDIESLDTINIITNVYNGLSLEDMNKEFKFYSFESSMYEIFSSVEFEIDKGLKNFGDLKIVRDPVYDFIANNKFSTTVGFISRE